MLVQIFEKNIYRLTCAVSLGLFLTACQNTAPEKHAEYQAERGQSVIAFTDAVPVFRKNGVFWKYGVNHNAIFNSPIAQKQANFELYEKTGLVVWTPNVGPITTTSYAYFEAEKPKGAAVTPFVNVGDTLYLMTEDSSAEVCQTSDNSKDKLANLKSFINDHAKVSKRLYDYLGQNIICVTPDKAETGAWMMPLDTAQSPEAIGFFFKGKKAQTISVKNFHLGTNAVANNDDILVTSKKTLDGQIPNELHVLTHDGNKSVIKAQGSGEFTLPRKLVETGPFRTWVDENKLAVFPTQGEWIDPTNLTDALTIEQTVEFLIDTENKNKNKRVNKRRKTPHRLSTWTGSVSNMKIQEYEGLTFTNNLSKADRDRFKDNTNQCIRGAIFGGSYVEAVQTKIAEKPAILSEPFASQALGQCVEFFTYGRSLGRAENFANDAKNLITEYNLDFVVFSISRLELCQQNDGYYIPRNGRDISTPKDWRIINGELIAPASPGKAIKFKPDDEMAKAAIKNCRYKKNELSQIEIKPLEKMKQIETILSKENENLEVLFFNFKDVLAENSTTAEQIKQNCQTFELKCYTASTPERFQFESKNNRYNQYLYRYKNDRHPNVRANQRIARDLTDMLIDTYQDK